VKKKSILSKEDCDIYQELLNSYFKGKNSDNLNNNNSEQEHDLDTYMIFSLADLLKSLDAGKYYDMAERLYSNWKNLNKNSFEKGGAKLARIVKQKIKENVNETISKFKIYITVKELVEEKQKLESYLQNVIKENEILDHKNVSRKSTNRDKKPKNNRQQNLYSSQISNPPFSSNEISETNKPLSPRSHTDSSIFDKLHSEAATKHEMKLLNEQIRKHKEVENCTFQPRIRSSSQMSPRCETQQVVYERLANSNKIQKQKYYEAQKEANEIKYCTFQPQLPKAGRAKGISQSALNVYTDENEPVYDRLHKRAEIIEQERQSKALYNKDKELDSCTFKPKINRGSKPQRSISQDSRFNDLYMDHAKKQQKLQKKELEREESLRKNYTFKPKLETSKLMSSLSQSELADNEVPRYERLYIKHAEKEKMLEKKRKELEEEERKLRAFATKKPLKSIENNNKTEPFDRLYNQQKVYKQKKEELGKKVLQELGVSFTPRINNTSIQLSEQDTRGVIERNEQFLKERSSKLSKQLPTELKECTFVPKVSKPGTQSMLTKDKRNSIESKTSVCERLYSYFEKYEKQKEEYRQKHLDD